MRRDGRATLRDIFRVMRARTLSLGEKVLWTLIRSHETVDKGAYPGDERLAAMMDKSVRSVERYRRSLLDKGYLEQQLRGPKPALYRAICPSKSDDKADGSLVERGDTHGDSVPSQRPDTSGHPSKASPSASPRDSSLVSPEYGEYGEKSKTEGSSLRSSPSGESAAVEHSRDAWNVRLAPLIRELAYQGQDPPRGHDISRCLSKARHLLKRGYSMQDLEDAIRGFRRMIERRDPKVRDWMRPGDTFTLLMFDRAEERGERLIEVAAHSWRKNGGRPDEQLDGLERIGQQLDRVLRSRGDP